MLASIAVEGFIWKYAMPIAGATLCILVLVGIYEIFYGKRTVKELVASGEVMKEAIQKKAVVTWKEVAPALKQLQSPGTESTVDKAQKKLRKSAEKAVKKMKRKMESVAHG